MSYNASNMKIISGSFAALDITGSSYHIGASLLHPVVVIANTKSNLFLNAHYKRSETLFSDIAFSHTEVASIEAGLDFLSYDEQGLWFLRGAATNGGHF